MRKTMNYFLPKYSTLGAANPEWADTAEWALGVRDFRFLFSTIAGVGVALVVAGKYLGGTGVALAVAASSPVAAFGMLIIMAAAIPLFAATLASGLANLDLLSEGMPMRRSKLLKLMGPEPIKPI